MHPNIVHCKSGKVFDTGFQVVGHTGLVPFLFGSFKFSLHKFIIFFIAQALCRLLELALQKFGFVLLPLYRIFELPL